MVTGGEPKGIWCRESESVLEELLVLEDVSVSLSETGQARPIL